MILQDNSAYVIQCAVYVNIVSTITMKDGELAKVGIRQDGREGPKANARASGCVRKYRCYFFITTRNNTCSNL